LPIPNKKADKILKGINLRYSSLTVEPALDANYEMIEVYSPELPIHTQNEFRVAEKIGARFNLKLEWMDFSRGEKGEEVKYEPVYVAICTNLKQLKEAPSKINRAFSLLKKELRR
jgi:hypothetical protein